MRQKTLALRQAYREGAEILRKAGIAEAELDAWLLLSHVTGVSRTFYYGNPDRPVTEEEIERYFECIEKRKVRIPLQHITGGQEFMGYSFMVNQHVLIPRQDTEVLAEEALKTVRPGMRILDLCTGSGCILLSLLKISAEKRHIDHLIGTGTDISEKALSVAEENAARLHIRAEFKQSDLFERITGRYDLIVSNPPYIPTGELEGLQEEVRLYDPRIALDGREDGLYFYKRIIQDGIRYLNTGGCLMFEIGHDQREAVSSLMKRYGYTDIYTKKDLSGLDRVVAGRYNGT